MFVVLGLLSYGIELGLAGTTTLDQLLREKSVSPLAVDAVLELPTLSLRVRETDATGHTASVGLTLNGGSGAA